MKRFVFASILAAFALTASASVEIGKPAPDFKVIDLGGKEHSLAEFKGKTVVLEWNNPGCPFVQKHYDSGNMPSLQKEFTAKGVVWVAVNSTNPRSSDFMDPATQSRWNAEKKATPTVYLADASGAMGRAYGAKTTPHMYVIDGEGKLAYAGGIDSIRSADPADIPKATNYVKLALGEMLAGKPVSTPSSTPYGCSVKY